MQGPISDAHKFALPPLLGCLFIGSSGHQYSVEVIKVVSGNEQIRGRKIVKVYTKVNSPPRSLRYPGYHLGTLSIGGRSRVM